MLQDIVYGIGVNIKNLKKEGEFKMKKLLSAILTMCMVVMSMSAVYADDTADDAVKVSIGSVTANSGDAIKVPVNVEDNTKGILGLDIVITYDKDVLTFTGLEQTGYIYQGMLPPMLVCDAERDETYEFADPAGYMKVSGAATKAYKGDGTLFVANFTVNDTTAKNVVSNIGLEIEDLYRLDSSFEQVSIDRVVTGGAVTVNYIGLWGDANNDGAVTAEDAAVVLQYALNYTELANAEVADVTQDGKVNSQDATMILQKVLDSSYKMACEK